MLTVILLGVAVASLGAWLVARKNREARRCPRCAELTLETVQSESPASDNMTAQQTEVIQRCSGCGFSTSFAIQAPSQKRRDVVVDGSGGDGGVPPGV
jgi:uncharacterized Zn finger protein